MHKLALLAALVAALPFGAAQAEPLHVVHAFTNGSDGGGPLAAPVMDAQGNLYAAAVSGGIANKGTLVKIAPDGTQTTLFDFASKSGAIYPSTPLLITHDGGLAGAGNDDPNRVGTVIYKISAAGHETVLATLTVGSKAGYLVLGGLAEDDQGNLYGATQRGAAHNCGAVFRLTRGHKLDVLYVFKGGSNDGCGGSSTLVRDARGNLTGTTLGGGPVMGAGDGVLFRISPSGAETVLHFFGGTNTNSDGAGPCGALLLGPDGALYGTTYTGGQWDTVGGTVWRFTAGGDYALLHKFPDATAYSDDGATPQGGLVRDAKGNLFGTTQRGGAMNYGAVFKLAPDGSETLLHSFVAKDGMFAAAGVTMDAGGTLFGATTSGGNGYFGTIFKINRRK